MPAKPFFRWHDELNRHVYAAIQQYMIYQDGMLMSNDL
jgi:hypothetical protein